MSDREGTKRMATPARYVQPNLTEARLQRVWLGVADRLPGRQRGRRVWRWAGALSLAAACVAALWFISPRFDGERDADSLLAGAVLETASDSLTMGLIDGSSLKLDHASRVEVAKSGPGGVRLKLKRGRIDCDVKPRKGSPFVVVADGVEVRVVGTRFSVATQRDAESHRVEVHVQRGVVEVRARGSSAEVVRLPAGRSWSQVIRTGPAERVKQDERAAEPAAPPASAEVPKVRESTEKPAEGPRELLEEANQLRREGRVRQAAERYEMLLNKYGSDPRAGLAAFELGRLRMDRFGDTKGAIAALEKAMALAPGSGFREDALARVVTAQARSGNRAGCIRARERYLKSYPKGVHRQAVLDQCD